MGRDHAIECEHHPGVMYSGFNGPDECPVCVAPDNPSERLKIREIREGDPEWVACEPDGEPDAYYPMVLVVDGWKRATVGDVLVPVSELEVALRERDEWDAIAEQHLDFVRKLEAEVAELKRRLEEKDE